VTCEAHHTALIEDPIRGLYCSACDAERADTFWWYRDRWRRLLRFFRYR